MTKQSFPGWPKALSLMPVFNRKDFEHVSVYGGT